MPNETPYISVIIPAFNEAIYISNLLLSLNRQSYPRDKYEIIVADNGSTDATQEIAEKLADKLLIIPEATISKLRNEGTRSAKGELFAFIDADCVADPKWLKNASVTYKKGYDVFGCKVTTPPNGGLIERTWFSQRYDKECQVSYLNTANLFIERKAFYSISGFNEKLKSGEDSDICQRLKKTGQIIFSTPTLKVVHFRNPKNIIAFTKREMWHGFGSIQTWRRNQLDKPFIGTILFINISLFQLLSINFHKYFFLLSIGLMVLLLLTATIHNVLRYKNYRHILVLVFLYYFYFLGRSASIFVYIFKKLRWLSLPRLIISKKC